MLMNFNINLEFHQPFTWETDLEAKVSVKKLGVK